MRFMRTGLSPVGGSRLASVAVVAGALIGLAAPAQSGPMAPHDLAPAASTITMVRDYCGKGYYRPDKTRDKWGAWRGKCVPIKKKAAPASQAAEQPAAPPAVAPTSAPPR